MRIRVSDDAEEDIVRGAAFYEHKTPELGDQFRRSMQEEIERLATFAGIHAKLFGYHRYLCRRFP